jgi:hypothetical protein
MVGLMNSCPMGVGVLLTRVTIWLALGGCTLSAASSWLARKGPAWQSLARSAWTAGCVAYLAHVISAFHYYHGWSHSAAYRETARRTAEAFGVSWGGGLFVNYAFTIAWIADALCWWRLGSYQRRPWSLAMAWHILFLVMVFSATVVFGTGLVRWLGLMLCLAMAFFWWPTDWRGSGGNSFWLWATALLFCRQLIP